MTSSASCVSCPVSALLYDNEVLRLKERGAKSGFDVWEKLVLEGREPSLCDVLDAWGRASQNAINSAVKINPASLIQVRSSDLKNLTFFSFQKNFSDLSPELTLSAADVAGITPSIAKCILQGEAGVTSSNAQQPIIGSFGAGPCVIVSVYNQLTKTGALAHVDALANPAQVMEMLSYQVSKGLSQPGSMNVEMATGWLDDNATLTQLKEYVSKNTSMSLSAIHCSESLAVDARSGKTIVGIDHHKMDLWPDYSNRLERRTNQAMFSFGESLHVCLAFDGRDKVIP